MEPLWLSLHISSNIWAQSQCIPSALGAKATAALGEVWENPLAYVMGMAYPHVPRQTVILRYFIFLRGYVLPASSSTFFCLAICPRKLITMGSIYGLPWPLASGWIEQIGGTHKRTECRRIHSFVYLCSYLPRLLHSRWLFISSSVLHQLLLWTCFSTVVFWQQHFLSWPLQAKRFYP